jgi:carboxyl-terminal processing protease
MKISRKTKYLSTGGALLLSAVLFISAARSDFDFSRNLEVLFNLFREVNRHYVDRPDPNEMMKQAATGMLNGLDPYTEFLPEDEMSDFEVMTTGKYGGIGALIRRKGEWVEIAQPYKGFAADRAGLKIGDRILEIDGESAKNGTPETVSGRLKGDPGTILKLKVERFADRSIEELSIRRERIEISGVSYYSMLNDSVGYLSHSDFTENCSGDIRDAIMEMKKQGMRSLVYDLRDNGGGILQEAVNIVGLFVPRQSEVVEIRGREEKGTVYTTQSNPLDRDLPVAVLISGGSASASEIVAGALQDYDRAVIVGQRSFGKGLVQSTRSVGFNNYVKLTTAKYYIPSGRCIQAIDYSHRDANGRVGAVPDSLIREFTTRNGRKVYDGGGIMPDVALPAESYSLFTGALYSKGYLEDFAMEYLRRHDFQPVDVDTFRLSDADYADFTAFMADREVEFESETRMALDLLRRAAEKERYSDRISTELAALTDKIVKNKNEELARLKPEISRLIEDQIVLYFHYAQGVERHNLPDDPELQAALDVLNDGLHYRQILSGQDARRN